MPDPNDPPPRAGDDYYRAMAAYYRSGTDELCRQMREWQAEILDDLRRENRPAGEDLDQAAWKIAESLLRLVVESDGIPGTPYRRPWSDDSKQPPAPPKGKGEWWIPSRWRNRPGVRRWPSASWRSRLPASSGPLPTPWPAP